MYYPAPPGRRCKDFIKPGDRPLQFRQRTEFGWPYDCGLCPDHEQHSCLALIEITEHCNLTCPVCFAESAPPPNQRGGCLTALMAGFGIVMLLPGVCALIFGGISGFEGGKIDSDIAPLVFFETGCRHRRRRPDLGGQQGTKGPDRAGTIAKPRGLPDKIQSTKGQRTHCFLTFFAYIAPQTRRVPGRYGRASFLGEAGPVFHVSALSEKRSRLDRRDRA